MIFDVKRSAAPYFEANLHIATDIGRLTIPLTRVDVDRFLDHVAKAAEGGAPSTSLHAVKISTFTEVHGVAPFTVIRGEGATVAISARPADWAQLQEKIGAAV